jgi:type IV pilus assembly protein PilC
MVTLTILLVVVLPRFAGLLSDMQQTLPPAAQLLVTISSGVPALLVIGGGLGAVGALSVHMTRRHADGRAALDRALLAIPVIGRLMHDASIVSITSTLASLLATGVPVADAVQICQGITSNEHTNCGLVRVRRDIVRGSSLSLALGTNAIITRAHVGILRAGEEVGSVPQSLEHIASLARDQLDARLRRTLATLEPAAILIVGGLIAIIAGILMQTIYAIQP